MQKAINRFWDWLFHPSIRWYHYPKGKSAWFRYPSPGNQINKQPVQDYRTPFEYSDYNVRYKKIVHSLVPRIDAQVVADGLGFKTIDKLRSAGFITDENPSEQQIQQAKKKFLTEYGVPVQTRVYKNDPDFVIPQPGNRESYRQAIQNQFKFDSQMTKRSGNPNIDRRFVQQPNKIDLQSLDLFCAPHFQQTRIEVNYKLDNHANDNAKRGYIEIMKGEKSFWKALDDSNDPKNIENVQRSVGDSQPNNFKLSNTKIEFQKDNKGNVVDVHPKTKSV